MGLVRCDKHGEPEGRVYKYATKKDPIGYPDTAAICGRKGCRNPGRLYLTEDEADEYRRGERIFPSVPRPTPGVGPKVRVS